LIQKLKRNSMELYLIKSGACLAIFYLFYKLFLEKENMHRFKRLYLLGMLFISFGIPLITFTTYAEISQSTNPISTVIISTESVSESATILDYLPNILLAIYIIGVIFFSIRFGKNILELLLRINRNQNIKLTDYINVLLNEEVVPHTFFSYIFLNKQKFEAQEIPEEVMIHEQTHAKQKHSLDVILIELLQIIFWFNPFIYFIKHSIKLNHEFLADRDVLSQGIDISNYQNILLAFSSNANTPQMANAINYSSSRLIGNSFKQVKKRFTVMKTHTSKTKIWMRSLLLLPLLAILIYSFSTKETLSKSVLENDNSLVKDFYLKIDSEENIYYNEEIISFDEIPNAINSYKKTYPNKELYFAKIDVENKESTENLFPFVEIIKENGIEKITACWTKDGATKEQLEEYNKLARKYNNQDKENRIILMKDLERLEYLYNLMTPEQKANAEPFPNIPPPPPPAPDKAPEPMRVKKGVNDKDPKAPPPPPKAPKPVKDPIKTIEKLSENGARFLFFDGGPHYKNGIEITKDRAIEVLKAFKDVTVNIINNDYLYKTVEIRLKGC